MPAEPKHHAVMVVGESPGNEDDVHGEPFLSPGYKDVKAFFASHGIHAYCTYAVKCRKPREDTKITAAHMKPCTNSYLLAELEAVRPEHVIVLGAKALSAVTKKAGIQALQGTRFLHKFASGHSAWIYPTFHPAQVIYDRAKRQPFRAELEMHIKWILKGEDGVKFDPPLEIVRSLDQLADVRDRMWEAEVIGSDTETMGLIAYTPDKMVRCAQFCRDPKEGGIFVPLGLEEDCYYTDQANVADVFWKKAELPKVADLLREIYARCYITWHNGKFDRLWLHQWALREFGDPILAPKIAMDTMHVAFLLNENRPSLKLKKLIVSDLGLPSYDIPNKLTKDLDVLIPYASKDTVGMMFLAHKYAARLREPEMARLRKFYERVLRPADALYTQLELCGWPLDAERAKKVLIAVDKSYEEVSAKIQEYLEEQNVEETADEVFNSNPQLAKLLFDVLGLPVNPDPKLAYSEKTNARSVDTDALSHIQKHPFIKMIFERRKLLKTKSTYVEPMLSAARGRGLLTTSYRPAKAVTGRSASGKEEGAKKTDEGMNLQNLPAKKDTHKLKTIIHPCNYFIRPEDEFWVWNADFSQIELVVAAQVTQDPLLLDTYQNGRDLHAIRAARMVKMEMEEWLQQHEDFRADTRDKAKPVNFGYLFDMSWRKFMVYALTVYGIEFTATESQNSRNDFQSDHPGLLKYYRKQERIGREQGYVESMSGRRRHLPNLRLDPDKSKENRRLFSEARRQAVNSPIQGFASDLKLMSMLESDKVLSAEYGNPLINSTAAKRVGPLVDEKMLYTQDATPMGEVHDAIVGVARKSVIEEVCHTVVKIMRHPTLLDTLGIVMDVPINAEVKIGPSYGELKTKIDVPR